VLCALGVLLCVVYRGVLYTLGVLCVVYPCVLCVVYPGVLCGVYPGVLCVVCHRCVVCCVP